MNGAGETTNEGRKRALEAMKQEIATQKPGYPFGFSVDLNFDAEIAEESPFTKLLRQAVNRDAAYGTACSVHMRRLAFNGGMRAVYMGGRMIADNETSE